MTINSTLLIQVVHFFIVYVLVRFFLLKPVVSLVQEEDRAHGAVLKDIAARTQGIQSQRTILNAHWQEIQRSFKEQIPVVDQRPLLRMPIVKSVLPERKEIDVFVRTGSVLLVDKVRHVR